MLILQSNVDVLGWINLVLSALILMLVVILSGATQKMKLKTKKFGHKKANNERIYDRELVCQKVAIAVENLSRTKTGALITFEMEDKFNEIIKSGTMIESPVSPELLVTIFYPGTRLHDGAVVIRRDELLAASVYYSPTTKPLTGKFGSRHRAAIGISEITDSVTVIVSEETGRISIAHKGELIPVSQDKFLTTLEEFLLGERD